MRKALIIWIFLVTHAGSKAIRPKDSLPTNTPSASFDVKAEFAKINEFCLTPEDIHELNSIPNYNVTEAFTSTDLKLIPRTMAFDQIRAALNFSPFPMPLNETTPSDEEIESVTTAEEYFNLMEQSERIRYSQHPGFNEKNMIYTTEFFDKRLPSLRAFFKYLFDTILRYNPDVSERSEFTFLYEWFPPMPVDTDDKPSFDDVICKRETDNEGTTTTASSLDISSMLFESLPSMMFDRTVMNLMRKPCPTDFKSNLFNYKISNGEFISFYEPTLDAIGIQELRAALNFASQETRNVVNTTDMHNLILTTSSAPFVFVYSLCVEPSHEERYVEPSHEDADTLEAYYNFNEPGSVIRTLDVELFYKNNLIPFENNLEASVAYFDEHFPAIRRLFRLRFQDTIEQGELDKEMIDRMIKEFYHLISQFFYPLMTCSFPRASH